MQNTSHIPKNQRTEIIDILRGWALIGVVLVNYFLFFYLHTDARIPENDSFSRTLKILTTIFFTNKSRMMLNILFGYGFAVLMQNLIRKGMNPVPFFVKRMCWLFVIGVLNTVFYYGDFLKDYAMMGLFMLPFYRVSAKTSLYISIALLLIFPAAIHYFYIYNFEVSDTEISLYKSHNLLQILYFGLK